MGMSRNDRWKCEAAVPRNHPQRDDCIASPTRWLYIRVGKPFILPGRNGRLFIRRTPPRVDSQSHPEATTCSSKSSTAVRPFGGMLVNPKATPRKVATFSDVGRCLGYGFVNASWPRLPKRDLPEKIGNDSQQWLPEKKGTSASWHYVTTTLTTWRRDQAMSSDGHTATSGRRWSQKVAMTYTLMWSSSWTKLHCWALNAAAVLRSGDRHHLTAQHQHADVGQGHDTALSGR